MSWCYVGRPCYCINIFITELLIQRKYNGNFTLICQNIYDVNRVGTNVLNNFCVPGDGIVLIGSRQVIKHFGEKNHEGYHTNYGNCNDFPNL